MISAITDFILLVSGSIGLSILAKATLVLLLGLIAGAIAGRDTLQSRYASYEMQPNDKGGV